MPNTTISYTLEARENLSAAMSKAAESLRAAAAAGTASQKEITAGLNATSKAAQALNNELKAQASLLTAEGRAAQAAANDVRAHAMMLDAQTRAAKASTAALTAESRAATQAGQAAQQAGANHTQAAGGITGLWKSVAGGTLVANLASKALSEIGQMAGDVGGAMVKGASDTEQFSNAFTRMLGSKQASDEFIASLRAFSIKTPFDFEGSAKAAQSLVNMGMASKDVVPLLTAMGDAVAANGGKTDEFNRAMLGYTQVIARGKTSAQDLNQISQAGVPIWDLLAAGMGKTRAEVVQLNEDGAITAEVFQQVFQAAASSKYAGAMAGQMNTLAGAVSSVADVIQNLGSTVLGPTLKVVEEEINKAVTTINDPQVQSTLTEWGTNLGKVAAAAVSVGSTIVDMGKQALDALRPVTDLIGGLIGALPDVKAPEVGGGANPVQPVLDTSKALGDQFDLNNVKTKDFKEEIAAAQDQLEGLRRTDQDRNYLLDQAVAGERSKLDALQRQYDLQDRATSLSRLNAKIARDEALAKNIYSAPGQRAAAELRDLYAQREDMQTAASRAGAKNEIESRISTLETAKKVEERKTQLAERAIQDTISLYQRAAQFEKEEAERRSKAFKDWQQQEQEKRARQERDNAAADAREDAHFALISGNSTTFTKQYKEDIGAQSKALEQLRIELDKVAVALGFPGSAEALKELRYQFAITAAFIGTHLESAGASLTHLIEGGNILALKARQAMGGDLSPSALAAIKKWDSEDAILNAGKSIADANFATQKHQLDIEFGKVVDVGGAAGRRNLDDSAAQPGTAQSHVAPPTGTIGPTPKATGGGGWGMGSLFGKPDLSIDPTTGKPYPGRASGGHQAADEIGWVGERGPELWQPDRGGTVIPLSQMGGGEQIVISTVCESCRKTETLNLIRRNGQLIADVAGSHIRGSRH